MPIYEYDNIDVETPDVVSDEVLHVYIPKASNNIAGIAKFDKSNFNVDDSANVSIKDDYVDGVVKNTNYHIKSLASETNKNNLYGIDNNGNDNLVPYSNGIVSNSVVLTYPASSVSNDPFTALISSATSLLT